METNNFEPMQAKALRNKAEVAYCVDEWISLLEQRKLEIELCEDAVQILRDRLMAFRQNILAMRIPTLTAQNMEYVLDIFDNNIQFGLVTWNEDVRFDEEGIPMDGDEKYELLMSVGIPYVSLDKWCEMNDVKPGTARQWVSRKRMRVVKEGRDLRISPIQYVPDAFFANKSRNIRFDGLRKLPEDIVTKFPFLGGIVVCIILLGDKSSKGENNIFVISKEDEDGTASGHPHTISETERAWLLRALLASDVIRCHSEQHYHSPLPEASWAKKSRFPVVTPTKDEVKMFFDLNITGKCRGMLKWGENPSFELTLEDGDYIKGSVVHLLVGPEESLFRALFGSSDEELREGLINKAGVNLHARYPWDEYVLLVTDMRVTPDANGDAVVLKGLHYIAEKTCAVRTTMTAFALKREAAETEASAAIIGRCGYQEILSDGIYKWKNRLFFGYTKF